MTDLLPCPSCGGPNGVNDIVRFVAKLTRSEQYDIAFKIAENIGHRIVSDDLPAQPQASSQPKCACGKPDTTSCYNPDCSRPA